MKTMCIGDKFKIQCYKHDKKIHREWSEAVLLDIKKEYMVFGNNATKIDGTRKICYYMENPKKENNNMKKTVLREYAKLIARVGANVQKGQHVIIHAGLDQPEFVTMCVEACYRAGAAKVMVEWSHQPLQKIKVPEECH